RHLCVCGRYGHASACRHVAQERHEGHEAHDVGLDSDLGRSHPMFLVPDFKGFDFFPHGTRLPFMRYKLHCLVLSTLLTVVSLGIILVNGFNYGVDFKGGALIEVRATSGAADVSEMRSTLSVLDLGDLQIQSLDAEGDVLIRIEQQPGEEEAQQA